MPAARALGRRPPIWSRLWPWVVGLGLLAALVARLPRHQLAEALAAGPGLRIGLYSAGVVTVVLAADALATRVAFAATGVLCPWSGVLLARGATYLLGVINAAVGQGGMALYLNRAGVAPLRATGTILFLFATQLAALALVAAGGALAPGAAGAIAAWLPWLGALLAGVGGYLALVAWRPRVLARHALLAPVFGAGTGGFATAVAARLPHMLLLLLGLWGGLRLWGVAVPLGQGTVLLTAVLLVMLLPIAPAGIGTLELALVAWIAPFAPQAAGAARQASVLAFSLVYHLFGLLAQAALGLLCLGALARRRGEAAAACTIRPES